jgi:regulatory protein
MRDQNLTPQQALQKIKHFCAYQERCHSEVKERLYHYGLNTKETDNLISTLIEENYLDEERFAVQFAGGKFRIKHWGRSKIRYELKKRQISDYCIKKGIQSIDETEYEATLRRFLEKEIQTRRISKEQRIQIEKIKQSFILKGYEPELIKTILQDLLNNKK